MDVKYVKVSGNTGWVAAIVTYDSEPGGVSGHWFFAKFLDGGTPGRKGDVRYSDWNCETDEAAARDRVNGEDTGEFMWTAIEGNLAVHSE